MTLDMLASRTPGTTICPSEVARRIARREKLDDDWRNAMPLVHAAVDELLAVGSVQLSWKGQPLPLRRDGRKLAIPEVGKAHWFAIGEQGAASELASCRCLAA
jgi:hypothetical protein